MKYHFTIRQDEALWIAQCIELAGCYTQTQSRNELDFKMKESLDSFLCEPKDPGFQFPLPRHMINSEKFAAVEVDPRIAFAMLLRQARTSRGWSQRKAADMMGFKNLYSYQRLEHCHTANPELMTLNIIKKTFTEFDLALLIG